MRYKELLNLLESEYDVQVGGASGVLRSAQSDFGTYRVENAAMITRINAFIHNYLKEACLEPKQTIFGLRQKLNQVGLDFEFSNKNTVAEGTMNLKLTRFGGVFGKSDTTPFDQFDNEDGFEKTMGHGLTLNLEMSISESGLYKLEGKVVPTISETSEEVEVEEAKANKDYDGDGKVESGTDEWKGSRDKAIKKSMASRTEDVEQDKKDFKPHMMYDPKTGKGYKADTFEDHLDMKEKGYVHEKPEVKEDVEQVDEISSDTLRSYVAKRRKQTVKDLSREDGGHNDSKLKKNNRGVVNALSRLDARNPKGYFYGDKALAREDVEQVDELKKSTLMSYKDKAKKSERSGRDTGFEGETPSEREAGVRQVKKRVKGIDGATRRLVARQYDKED